MTNVFPLSLHTPAERPRPYKCQRVCEWHPEIDSLSLAGGATSHIPMQKQAVCMTVCVQEGVCLWVMQCNDVWEHSVLFLYYSSLFIHTNVSVSITSAGLLGCDAVWQRAAWWVTVQRMSEGCLHTAEVWPHFTDFHIPVYSGIEWPCLLKVKHYI